MYVLKPYMYLKQLKVRITDQCIQSQNARIQESSKLILFKNIHIEGSRPTYVDTLKYIKDRSAVCKIRLSAHNLMIEKGRYLNIEQKSKCHICKEDKIEDEEHFFYIVMDINPNAQFCFPK